jgi:hypothetical protein
MSPGFLEGARATRYRQRLAAMMRSASCRSIAFSIGTAPIHRNFFAETAAAIEGVPTGGTRKYNGVVHRQVQYGVHLRIDETAERASFDPDADLLTVPKESALDTLDARAGLISACVHVGLNLEGRNLHAPDSECAARICGQLYRMFESIADGDSESDIAVKLGALEPEAATDKAFYGVARKTLMHLRSVSLANLQARHALKPGSFLKIVSMTERDLLHAALLQAAGRRKRAAVAPRLSPARPPSRFLALQAMDALAPGTAMEKPKLNLPRVPLLVEEKAGDGKVVAFAP